MSLITPWEAVAHQLAIHALPEELAAYQFMFTSPLTTVSAAIQDFAANSFPPRRPILEGAIDLIERIFTEFTYDKAATTVETAVEQVLRDRKGVCQDFAHLTISCLRSLGLAARYVSGYLETLPPPPPASPSLLALMPRMPGFRSMCRRLGGWTWIPPTT